MKFKKLFLITSTLLSYYTSSAMENPLALPEHDEAILTKDSITIEENFKKSFGYAIPTNENDYQKTNFKKFIKHSTIWNTQEECFSEKSSAQKIQIITNESLRYLEQEEHAKIVAAERLRLEEQITASRLRHEKLITQEKVLREKLAAQEKIRHTMEAENKRLRAINTELAIKAKEQEKAKQIAEQTEKQQRIFEAQKKERALKAAQKKATPKVQAQRPEQCLRDQKFAIKRKFIKSNNFQTEAQLKKYLYKCCMDENSSCIGSYITGTHTAFHYTKKTGELVIMIGDEIDLCAFCKEED